MKLRLPQRRATRAAIYLGSFVLVLLALDLVLVQVRRTIHPSYETTRIIEPKMADGRIDYCAAVDELFGRGVTPENNAAIPALRAFGPEALSPKQPPNGVTDRLGMEPLPESGQYFKPFNDTSEPGLTDEINSHSKWPIVIGPKTRAWVAENQRPLDLIVEGSHRSRFFIPFDAGYHPDMLIEVYLKHALRLRQSCQALLTRAMIRLDAGDGAGYLENAMAVHRWTRLISQSQTLVERVMAFGLEAKACEFDRLAVSTGKLSASDLRAMNDELVRMGDLPSPLDTVDAGERYMTLDLMQWMAKGGPSRVAFSLDVILKPMGPEAPQSAQASLASRIGTQFLPVDYDGCMARLNAFYDGALAAERKSTYKERRYAVQLWEDDVNSFARRNRVAVFLSSDWPAMMLLPALMSNVVKDESARAQLRLTRVATGLAMYKLEHGSYPRALAELSPQYLRNMPVDPFVDEPFRYESGGSAYVLYSVGPDMVDAKGTGDDLVAGTPRTAPATSTSPAKSP